MFLTAVRHEVNNLESSDVVQELELAINLALWVFFMEFRKPVQRRNFVLIFFSFDTKM